VYHVPLNGILEITNVIDKRISNSSKNPAEQTTYAAEVRRTPVLEIDIERMQLQRKMSATLWDNHNE
jgi:hypothetical protein